MHIYIALMFLSSIMKDLPICFPKKYNSFPKTNLGGSYLYRLQFSSCNLINTQPIVQKNIAY